MRPGWRLTEDAQAERDDFDIEYDGGNCSCHLSPPCGSCLHPGNPHNQEEDATAWEIDSPITREQFELVRPLLEGQKKRTRPRQHDLYAMLWAVLYYIETKTPWRDMPLVTIPWRTAHQYYTDWCMPPRDGGPSVLEQVQAKLSEVQP